LYASIGPAELAYSVQSRRRRNLSCDIGEKHARILRWDKG